MGKAVKWAEDQEEVEAAAGLRGGGCALLYSCYLLYLQSLALVLVCLT